VALIHDEPKPPNEEQLTVRVDPEKLGMIERHCEFSSSTHLVIEQAPLFTVRKDTKFQERLSPHGATGRERKAETPAAGARPR